VPLYFAVFYAFDLVFPEFTKQCQRVMLFGDDPVQLAEISIFNLFVAHKRQTSIC
jgi:hypothetical protein